MHKNLWPFFWFLVNPLHYITIAKLRGILSYLSPLSALLQAKDILNIINIYWFRYVFLFNSQLVSNLNNNNFNFELLIVSGEKIIKSGRKFQRSYSHTQKILESAVLGKVGNAKLVLSLPYARSFFNSAFKVIVL